MAGSKDKEMQFLVATFSKLSRKKARKLYHYLNYRVQENSSDTRCKNLIGFMYSLCERSPSIEIADHGQLKGLVRALSEVDKQSWFAIVLFIINAAEKVVAMKRAAAKEKVRTAERQKNSGIPNPDDPLVKQIIRPI